MPIQPLCLIAPFETFEFRILIFEFRNYGPCFLVTRDGKPWFIVEVKYRKTRLSSTLAYFQQQTECAHAFQMVIEGDFVEKDCFSYHKPVVVSARALLSQLL